jgi:hypothetical protein
MDCETALRRLRAIDSYLTTGAGDMKKLQPPRHEFRFRLGDDRVLFLLQENTPSRSCACYDGLSTVSSDLESQYSFFPDQYDFAAMVQATECEKP